MPPRAARLVLAFLLLLLLALGLSAGSPAGATPQFPDPWPDYSVVPILFVPTDWSVSSDEVKAEAAALRSALHEIQRFYGDNNTGHTFTLNSLQVVQANGPKEAYHIIWNGRNIYEDGVEFDGNMEAAVVSELHDRGFPTPEAQNESGSSSLIFVKGAGGWAGGREFPGADGGWAILGDWAIDSIQGQVPEGAYWWSGHRIQTGASAHELGHTFDLPHPRRLRWRLGLDHHGVFLALPGRRPERPRPRDPAGREAQLLRHHRGRLGEPGRCDQRHRDRRRTHRPER